MENFILKGGEKMNEIQKMQKILKVVSKKYNITLEELLKPANKYQRAGRNETIRKIRKKTKNITLKMLAEIFEITPQAIAKILKK